MTRRPTTGAWTAVRDAAPTLLLVAAAAAVWELLARGGHVSALLFPPPSRIVPALVGAATGGDLATHLGATLLRFVPGLLLGAAPGLILGLAMGWSSRLRRIADPIVAAAHPIPKITLLPLVMVVFGIGESSRMILVAIGAFFPMLIDSMAGVRQISPLYLEVAENYGASRFRLFVDVILPGSLPMALSGFRLAANVALILTVAMEMLIADTGLGAVVWLSWELLRTELLYATILLVAMLGITIRVLLTLLERAVVPWQVAAEESA